MRREEGKFVFSSIGLSSIYLTLWPISVSRSHKSWRHRDTDLIGLEEGGQGGWAGWIFIAMS